MALLNQDAGFDEVRWTIGSRVGTNLQNERKALSPDWRTSFRGKPKKVPLPFGSHLFRLIHIAAGEYFNSPWWMAEDTFRALYNASSRAKPGNGEAFRELVGEGLALPPGGTQLSLVEIRLRESVFAWTGLAAPLFNRRGLMPQIFLPNLSVQGQPQFSDYASVVATYSLRF